MESASNSAPGGGPPALSSLCFAAALGAAASAAVMSSAFYLLYKRDSTQKNKASILDNLTTKSVLPPLSNHDDKCCTEDLKQSFRAEYYPDVNCSSCGSLAPVRPSVGMPVCCQPDDKGAVSGHGMARTCCSVSHSTKATSKENPRTGCPATRDMNTRVCLERRFNGPSTPDRQTSRGGAVEFDATAQEEPLRAANRVSSFENAAQSCIDHCIDTLVKTLPREQPAEEYVQQADVEQVEPGVESAGEKAQGEESSGVREPESQTSMQRRLQQRTPTKDADGGSQDLLKADPYDPRKRQSYLSWDDYFMAVAFLSAQRSKDPNRQVGACIVGEDKVILGIGYNGFPRGIDDGLLPWAKASVKNDPLETKYPYVCHAEVNAVLNRNMAAAGRQRIYVTMYPCNECAKILIQAGISEVVFFRDKPRSTALASDPTYVAADKLFTLAGVKVWRHVPLQPSILLQFC